MIDSGIPWAILQPSIMFGGPDAAFVHAMANLVRRAPVVPVPGDGKLLLQLVWVDDVARCLVALVDDDGKLGARHPIGGPEELTYDDAARRHRQRARQAARAQAAPSARPS